MTKQQEFLDKLIDPNKARLKEGIRYFLDHNENIRAEYMLEFESGYVVDLTAHANKDIEDATDNFATALKIFLDSPLIHIRANWIQPGFHTRSFFILKQSLNPRSI